MNVRDEGVVKYRAEWHESALDSFLSDGLISNDAIMKLIEARNQLFQEGWIGVADDGIGFGNISVRTSQTHLAPQFLITATQTGHLPKITQRELAFVTECDPTKNYLICYGAKSASSEAMTHFALYAMHDSIGAVIHIHSNYLWLKNLNRLPTIPASVAYGTPQMAAQVATFFEAQPANSPKLWIMAGHDDGIIAFGKTLQQAYGELAHLV